MHWIVVSNQKEAKIFVKTNERQRLKLLEVLVNPLSGEKRSALIRKQAGRGVKSIGRICSISYSEPKRHDPLEEASIQFAKQFADFLQKEKFKNRFSSVTIVAEPRFLGKLRSVMSSKLKASVVEWIRKDLQKTPKAMLADSLRV